MASTAARNPAIAGVLKRPFAEQAAFFRAKLGNLVPTARWTDMQRAAHDRGFMVAGAQAADLLADLAAAVDRGVTEGVGIDAFRKDFKAAVQKAGWAYNGEFNARTRTIYQTNITTSYAAGRMAQLREGSFPLYLYKHGDSRVPRAQHVAWDGLVLPADHEFWATHSPPNDWGCTCRMVGLRRAEDATALGGDPDKPLPDGWDAINPKTGAPVGIGKGWDYAPGDSVSDTVAQMAAKTQQWDYTLAKAYMEGVPEGVRDALATAYRNLPSVADDTRLYAMRAIENPADQTIKPRTMGLLTGVQAAEVEALVGSPVPLFDWSLDSYSVLHVQGSHGDADTEAPRGQRPVAAADYRLLPRLISSAERLWRAKDGTDASPTGAPVVRITGVMEGERFTASFEVRRKKRSLGLLSLWIGKP